ncbi:hypothetical protein HN51_060226 [Arachis hypogaea]
MNTCISQKVSDTIRKGQYCSIFHILLISEELMEMESIRFKLILLFSEWHHFCNHRYLRIRIVSFLSKTHELCAETSCPVSIGDFNVVYTQVLPGFTPPGSYSLKMKMFDGSKNEVTYLH